MGVYNATIAEMDGHLVAEGIYIRLSMVRGVVRQGRNTILYVRAAGRPVLMYFVCSVTNPNIKTLLGPQSRFFGAKPLNFQVVCPRDGTAVLKGLTAPPRRGAWVLGCGLARACMRLRPPSVWFSAWHCFCSRRRSDT